jgi:cobalamin biosynthetic protein CobC
VQAFERLFEHGGDINSAAEAFPDAPQPWIDLSTGINPVAYPAPDIPLARWTRLPSPAVVFALQEVAAARYGARADEVVVAPGTQALIQVLPRVRPQSRVAILGPTYSGHVRAWSSVAEVTEVSRLSDLPDDGGRIVVNPNNPDGRRWPAAELRALARPGALLVVDEAFGDFQPETLCADPPSDTVALRSFGKTYGLAGLRLGFAVARAPLAARLREALGAWAVSGPALEIGLAALADAAWLRRTRARLEADARRLDAALTAAGFAVVGGTPLFRLAARDDAAEAFQALARQGVLTRPFAWRPDWLRFGLPGPQDWPRVEAALRALRPAS